MTDKFMYIKVKAPSGDTCWNCPHFVLEHMDYTCILFNRYIHAYQRLPECIEKFGE